MEERTNISGEIDAAGIRLELDKAIKKILSDKQVLAKILNISTRQK